MSKTANTGIPGEWRTTMTNHQFDYLMELKDKYEALEYQNEELYRLVKAQVELGKSPEEILAAVEAFKKSHP